MTDDEPVWRRQYDVPIPLKPRVQERLQEYINEKVIRHAPPGCQYNSPLMVAPKGDNDIRLCFDARGINKKLVDENFTIPKIRDLFEKLKGYTVCSRLDLRNSYNQLKVKESDQHITAFTWEGQQYVWVGAPFGLKTLTAKFQRTMQRILQKYDYCVVIFVDDILVFSNSIEEHIEDLKGVINSLSDVNLRLRWEKCEFGLSSVKLLGHVVSATEVRPDPKKVSAFAELPVPKTGKEMQRFLGVANYLRDYIPCYAQITAHLEPLRHAKDLTDIWNEKHQQAVERLKTVLSSAPIISTPDMSKPFHVQTDASQTGVGAALYQIDDDGTPRYTCFASSALRLSQRNYPATKRELLAIVFALKTFRRWLYGGPKFTLYTDHSALHYLFTSKQSSEYMLLNWSYILSEYEFDVVHRPGVSLILPDALSRMYSDMKREQSEFEPTVVAKSNRIPTKRKRIGVVNTVRVEDAHMEMGMKTFIKEHLNKKDPGTDRKRREILREFHNQAHESSEGLYRRVWNSGYWWNGMRKMVNEFSSTCEECLIFNVGRAGFHPLTSIAATYPGDHWAIDLAGPFTLSNSKHKYIIVFVDIATRFVWLRCVQNNTSEEVARKFYKIASEFGFPKIVQSDNDPILVSHVIERFKVLCGFDHRTVSQYHARANGVAESHVKLTKNLLNKAIKGNWPEWDKYVPAIQMELNNRIWSKNETRPSAAMFARPFNGFKDYRTVKSKLLSPKQLKEMHSDMVELVYPTLRKKVDRANEKVANRFNKKHKIVKDGIFKPGHKVYLLDQLANSKREPKWSGPCTIVKKTRHGSYIIKDWAGNVINRKIAPSKLKPAGDIGREFKDVRGIIDHRGPNNNREYQIVTGEGSTMQQVWLPADQLLHEYHHILSYWDRKAEYEEAEEREQDMDGDLDYVPEEISKKPRRKRSVSTRAGTLGSTASTSKGKRKRTDHAASLATMNEATLDIRPGRQDKIL